LCVVHRDEKGAVSPGKEDVPVKNTQAMPMHWLLLCVLPTLVINSSFVVGIVRMAIDDDRYTHVLVIPLVAIYTLWQDAENGYRRREAGGKLALAVSWVGISSGLWGSVLYDGYDAVFLRAWVLLVGVVSGFLSLYGWQQLCQRRFVFLLLALAMPPSEMFLVGFEQWLQRWSANVTQLFFDVVGLSYIRSELTFSLAGIEIVVAKECSGVRSAIAIFVAVVAASRFLAASGWGRILVCAAAIPVAVIKNGLRITFLGALAVWVSPDVLQGPLHRYGGMIFSIVGLFFFVPFIALVRLVERRFASKSSADENVESVVCKKCDRADSKGISDSR
jgi:exosortase